MLNLTGISTNTVSLTVREKEKVKNMIIVLGLNDDYVKMLRREYLLTILTIEHYSGTKEEINQFHTAYGMLS